MNKLSTLTIVRFWLPLAATWLMMTIEGPFLAAVIARLADPKLNLAAYGIAFSLALIVEAPVIMILSASVALVTDRPSFLKLRRFTYALCAAVTLVMLVFVIPAVFHWIAQGLIGPSGRYRPADPHHLADHDPLAGSHRVPTLLSGGSHPLRPHPAGGLRHRRPAVRHGHGRPGPRRPDRARGLRRWGGAHRGGCPAKPSPAG